MQFASKKDKIIINILAISLLAVVLGIVYNIYPVFASPPGSTYYPGETTNPTCSPTDPNCTVAAPLTTTIVTSTSVTMGTSSLNFDSGTFFIDAANNLIGIGTTTPAVKLQVVDTSTQLRLGYDTNNYSSFAVGSDGALTITPVNNVTTTVAGMFLASGNSYFGTIASGTWNGVAIGNTYGGTGQNSSAWTGFVKVTSGTWATSTIATTDLSDSNLLSFLASNQTFTGQNIFTATSTLATTTISALTVSNSLTLPAGSIGASELASTAVSANTYGGADNVAIFTVDADGRLTAASTSSIALAASQITSGALLNTRGGTGQDSSAWTGFVKVTGGTWATSSIATTDLSDSSLLAFLANNQTFTGQNIFSATSTLATTTISALTVSGALTLPVGSIGASELASTAVSANSYGGADNVAIFTVDADGRLTAASTSSIALAASQITSGALLNTRGGTGQDSSAWTGFVKVTGGTWATSSIATTDLSDNSLLSFLANNQTFTGLNTFSATTSLVTTTISGSLTLSNGQILAPTGTLSLPTYSFGSDPNTGIYSSAADKLELVAGGAMGLQVNSSGYVGIGQAAGAVGPSRLEVSGQIIMGSNSLGSMGDSLAAIGEIDGGSVSYFSFYGARSTGAWLVPAFNAGGVFKSGIAYNGNGTYRSAVEVTGITAGTYSNLLLMRSGGNVGIGTTLPDQSLEVNGATGGNIRLTYNDSDGGAANYTDLIVGSAGALTVSSTNSGITTFNTGGLTLSNGQILAPTGTVSLPTYSFGTDPNTGIYSSAADTFNIATNGTIRFGIGSTGLIGVGGANVSGATIDLRGSIVTGATGYGYINDNSAIDERTGTGVLFGSRSGGNVWLQTSLDSDANLRTAGIVYVASSTKRTALEITSVGAGLWGNLLLMKSGGKVGIGNTSPSSTFHVSGTSTFQSSEANALQVRTADGTDKYFSVDGSEVNSGNISIGQTGSGIAQSVIRFRTDVRDGYIAMYNSTGQMDFYPAANGGLVFNFKERMKIWDYGYTALFKNNASASLTAGTEYVGMDFDMSATKSWATGALALQRENLFRTSTYAFTSASTIARADTVSIMGPPVAGTNATITQANALYVGGLTNIVGTTEQLRLGYDSSNYSSLIIGSDGALTVSSTNSATTTFQNGLVVNTNSLVVAKTTGNVTIGTTTPSTAKLYIDAGASTTYGLAVNGYIQASGYITGTTTLDIAENYPVNPLCETQGNCPEVGDVVCAVPNSIEIEKCTTPYSEKAIGIVSGNPGFLLGGVKPGIEQGNFRAVALGGRVPVNISTVSGTIQAGDYLTSSDQPGVAIKGKNPGRIIGVALQAFSETNTTGTIIIFVNPHQSYGQLTADDISNDLPDTFGEYVLDKFTLAIKNSLRMLGMVIQNGVAKVKEIYADKMHTNELCVGETCLNESQLQQLLQASGTSASSQSSAGTSVTPVNEVPATIPSDSGQGQEAGNTDVTPTPTDVPVVSETPVDSGQGQEAGTVEPTAIVETPVETPVVVAEPVMETPPVEAPPAEAPVEAPAEAVVQ